MFAAHTKDTTARKASIIAEHNSEVEIGIRENEIPKLVTFETHRYKIGASGILIDCLIKSDLQQMCFLPNIYEKFFPKGISYNSILLCNENLT